MNFDIYNIIKTGRVKGSEGPLKSVYESAKRFPHQHVSPVALRRVASRCSMNCSAEFHSISVPR